MQQVIIVNGKQVIINTDVSKIFLGHTNRYSKEYFLNNGSYDPLTLYAGTAMARLANNNGIVPFNAAASDGSQFFIGLLAEDIVVESGEDINPTICIQGDFAKEKIIFAAPATAYTTNIANQGKVIDIIRRQGLNPIEGTEMTQYDNQ